jgi:hypothetical protein
LLRNLVAGLAIQAGRSSVSGGMRILLLALPVALTVLALLTACGGKGGGY